MQPLPLPSNFDGWLIKLGVEKRVSSLLVAVVINKPFRQCLGEYVRHKTEHRNILFEKSMPCRDDLLVLAFMPAKEYLHGEAVPTAIAFGVTENPEINIFQAENLQRRVVRPLVRSSTDPALLNPTRYAFVRVMLYIGIRVRFLIQHFDKLLQVLRLSIDQLMLSATRKHATMANSGIVESVEPDVEM